MSLRDDSIGFPNGISESHWAFAGFRVGTGCSKLIIELLSDLRLQVTPDLIRANA
jgi:hypothetical protein